MRTRMEGILNVNGVCMLRGGHIHARAGQCMLGGLMSPTVVVQCRVTFSVMVTTFVSDELIQTESNSLRQTRLITCVFLYCKLPDLHVMVYKSLFLFTYLYIFHT
jgi:hypothetical protein